MSAADARLDPLACAAFLVAAFVLAGLVQVAWLKSRLSLPFRVPIDGGRTLRGRRLLGENKTWGGFVVMVPAVGAACLLLALGRDLWPGGDSGLWPLSSPGYGLLGCWLGFAFMAGELPNSFLKRQLDIAPGSTPRGSLARGLWAVIDRLDSLGAALIALAFVLPTPLLTGLAVLLVGPGLHGLFSLLLARLGAKGRPA